MEPYQFNFNPFKEAVNSSQKEHEIMLMNLKVLLSRPDGKVFMKYLMKHFGVGEIPPIGMDVDTLRDFMGFSRAGESIFSIAAQADPITTGILIAEIQKEKYNV